MSEATKHTPKASVPTQAAGRAESAPDSTPPVITRAEHHAFGDLDELTRKAGVSERDLARVVAKELGDNALDKAESCTYGRLKRGGFYVQNRGTIPGGKRDIAALFSTGRPQTSTKLYRRPARGALGNGLRVVAGAVLASGGRLVVWTGGRCFQLKPRPDGTTAVRELKRFRTLPEGVTRVAVWLGPDIPVGGDVLECVALAAEIAAAPKSDPPADRPSVHWHTLKSFANLLRDSGGATVRAMVEEFDKLSGKVAEVCAGLSGAASELSPVDVAMLFERMKKAVPPPSHDALGRVGDLPGRGGRPKWQNTAFDRRGVRMPARVEVWAQRSTEFSVTVCVNRTPCLAKVVLRIGQRKGLDGKSKQCLCITGAGVNEWIENDGRKPAAVLVNIQCPAVQLTDDGKTPDLGPIAQVIVDNIARAVKTATRATSPARSGASPATQKQVVHACILAAAASISLGGKVVYSLRNLFYALRLRLIRATGGKEPDYKTFSKIVQKYEDEEGDLAGLYRDNRGTLYEPHTGKEMPLGTRTAAAYSRPPLLFNKVLYCEKEGFFPQLRAAGWPERHDCALLTSKGFATRAVGDLLALMDESDEPLTIFCVHDADGPGTRIFQSLQELVNKRAGRLVRVVNLGLDPAEAVELGLQIEPVTPRKGKKVTTGDYLSPRWKKWLQTQRVELNAIEPAAFLDWLDGKMAGYTAKVVPPAPAVAARLQAAAEKEVREQEMSRIFKEAGYDDIIAAKMARLVPALEGRAAELSGGELSRELDVPRLEHWHGLVDEAGAEVVADESSPRTAPPTES